jgi:hypothetical protein
MLYSSNKENLTCRDKRITANFYICTNEIPGENQIPNIKIIKIIKNVTQSDNTFGTGSICLIIFIFGI